MKFKFCLYIIIVLISVSCSNVIESEKHFNKAYKHYLNKNFASSQKFILLSLKFNPLNKKSNLLHGEILFHTKKYDDAQKRIKFILKKYPCFSDAHLLNAKIKLNNYKLNNALLSIKKGLECSSSNPALLYYYGKVKHLQNKDSDAIVTLNYNFHNYYYLNKSHISINNIYKNLHLNNRQKKHQDMIDAINTFKGTK